MVRSGIALLALLAVLILPGEAYRLSLQGGVRRALRLAVYRVSDAPQIGVPGRVLVGGYLTLLAVCLLLLGRFRFPDVVPDVRPILAGTVDLGPDLLRLSLWGAVVVLLAVCLGVVAGLLHARIVSRRIEGHWRTPGREHLVLPWTASGSEPWAQALLLFRSPHVLAYLRDAQGTQPVAGRLVAADIFTAEKDGRGVLLQPLDALGAPDESQRILIRAEDVRALVVVNSAGGDSAKDDAEPRGPR